MSDAGKEKLRAYGIAPPHRDAGRQQGRPLHRPARHGRGRPLPALRFGEHGRVLPFRIDGLQGAVQVPGLPGTVRLFQAVLSTGAPRHVSPPFSRTHRQARQPRSRRLGGGHLRHSRIRAGCLQIRARPVPDPACQGRWPGRPPQLFDQQPAQPPGQGRRTGDRHPPGRGRPVFQLGRANPEGRRPARGDAAGRPLHGQEAARHPPRRLRRRLGDHAHPVDRRDHAGRAAGMPSSRWSTATAACRA